MGVPREPEPVPGGDVDIAAVGALVADRARCRILLALGDGRALPASHLALEAGVSAATASSHLAKLTEGGLLAVEARGRHRYYHLAGPAVGNLIEALEQLAPVTPVRSLRQATRAQALRAARTCYDHLAGRLGVGIMTAMLERGLLTGGDGRFDADRACRDPRAGFGHDLDYELTGSGETFLAGLGLPGRRGSVRYCVDWSEQRHHLGGPVGRGLLDGLLARDWVRRTETSRAVVVTPSGHAGLAETFGVAL